MSGDRRGGSFDSLSEFVATAKGVVATGGGLDETNTKAKLVTPLIRTLGWHVHRNNEVLLEYSGEAEFDDKADYALFDSEGLYAAVEAKRIGTTITESNSQIRRYMRLFGAEWGLLTNGEKYLIYRSDDDGGESLVNSVSLSELDSNEEIRNLTRQRAYSDSKTSGELDKRSEKIPDETVERIIEISESETVHDDLIKSIAPSVPHYEEEKFALLLSMVGGVPKLIEGDRAIRGSIHVSVTRDPESLIDELIESAAQLTPQSVLLSGGLQGREYSHQEAVHDLVQRIVWPNILSTHYLMPLMSS